MAAPKKEPTPSLKRLQKNPLPSFSILLLPVLAVLSSFLLMLALPGLIGADGPFDLLKCFVIGLSAGVTAYAVNRYALERGATQAAIGSWSGGLASVASVLMVGTGLALATYPGLVIEETDRLRLADYGSEHAAWLQDAAPVSQDAARSASILNAVSADLERNVACEAAASCVSGRGNGGEGPTHRRLLGALGRIEAVAAELNAAQAGQRQVTSELSALQDMLGGIIADNSLSGTARRLQTQQLTSRIGAAGGERSGVSPAALVGGLAQELVGNGIAGPEGDLLRSYGAQLASALSPDDPRTSPPPAFPRPTGVADTLAFIGHFLPVALLVVVIELILPLTLWIYTVIDLRTRLEDEERRPLKRPRSRRTTSPKT